MNSSPASIDASFRALSGARLVPEERSSSLFRRATRDAWLALAALVQGLLTTATVPLVHLTGLAGAPVAAAYLGIALWWCSNTVSHNHLHNPLFRSRRLNAVFSAFLSVLLGVPQAIWRARHLAHHAGDARLRKRWPLGVRGAVEVGLVGASWIGLALFAPGFMLFAYLPGYALGMGLAALQGHYEHEAERGGPGSGVSYYGRLYNLLWFNDGYHVEHHRSPGEHWTQLPARRPPGPAAESAFPPALRWLEAPFERPRLNQIMACVLGVLERLVLGSDALQRFVIARHERAIRALLPALGGLRLGRIGVVGGGLFPRTVIALRRILPESTLVVVDESAHNIALARRYLARSGHGERGVEFVEARFDPRRRVDFDLVVTPLALVGDRDALYAEALATPVLVHDWIWRARGDRGVVVSLLLGKRLNLVHRKVLS